MVQTAHANKEHLSWYKFLFFGVYHLDTLYVCLCMTTRDVNLTWGFHSVVEDYCHLGYDTVLICNLLPTFWRCLLPPSPAKCRLFGSIGCIIQGKSTFDDNCCRPVEVGGETDFTRLHIYCNNTSLSIGLLWLLSDCLFPYVRWCV